LRWSFEVSGWSVGLGVEVVDLFGLSGGQDVGVYEIGACLGYLGRAEALERRAQGVCEYARVYMARFYVVAFHTFTYSPISNRFTVLLAYKLYALYLSPRK